MYLTDEGRSLATVGIMAQKNYINATLGQFSHDDLAEIDRLVVMWRDTARTLDQD
jgi:MarR family transcriptional regulator, organic hydroperoxide resistance regulator